MISSQIDMENLIKKNFMMQSDKLNVFAETNPVQLTLREEVEIINQQNSDLQQKIKKLQDQIYSKNKDNDTKDIKDEEAKFKKMESDLCIAQMQLGEEEKKCKNLESHQVQLKSSLRNAEDKVSRYETWYIPRLKETKKYQKEL